MTSVEPRSAVACPIWLTTLLWAAVGVGLVGYLALYLEHTAALVAYPFDLDQGEGYDVWAAWRLLHGEPLYTDNATWPYFSTNYPPLYFVLLAPLLQWFGLAIGVGRALAAAATLGTGLLVFYAAREHTRHTPAAALAALLYLGSSYVYHVGSLARVNTVMVLLALAAVVFASRPTRARVPAALACAVLAAFAKPTALDALLAVLLFLWLHDRRVAIGSVALTIVVGLSGVIVLEISSGRAFLLNVVAGNANPWDAWQAFAYTANFVGVHHVVAIAAVGTVWLHRGRAPSAYALFLVVALLASLGAGKWGAGESYYLESLAALCIVAAPYLAHAIQQRGTWLSAAAAAALIWQLAIYAHGERVQKLLPSSDLGFQAHALGARPSAADTLAGHALVESYVLKWDGPVLAEDAGFAIVAGKPVMGNATHLRNLYDAGRWDATWLVEDIEAQRFDFVILHAQLYPPPVLEAIGRHYYLHATVKVNGYNYQVFAPGAT